MGNTDAQPTTLEVLVAIAFYCSSIVALTFFNKWFLSASVLHFHFPLSVTCIQQFYVFLLTWFCENLFLKKMAGPITKDWSYAYLIGPIGIMCAFDWGISNLSLKLINVSLYEMIKGSTPLFVLVLSFALGLQRPAMILLLAIAFIAVGTYLAICGIEGVDKVLVAGFPLFGALLCLTGAFFSGARSVFTQLVMQRWVDPTTGKSKVNSVTAVFYVAPSTSLSLLIPMWYFERAGLWQWYQTATAETIQWTVLELFGASIVAFCVTISSFMLTKKTSALTYSVVQIGERVTIVGLAMVTFGDHVGIWNAIGFGSTLTGIALYHHHKMHAHHKDEDQAAHDHDDEELKRLAAANDASAVSPSEGRRGDFSSVAAFAGVGQRSVSPQLGVAQDSEPIPEKPIKGGAPSRSYGSVQSS